MNFPDMQKRLLVLGAVAVLGAGGCSELRDAAGIGKRPPDEFRVLVRAPLSLPRDYGLKAPKPGAPRPQESAARERGRQIVIDTQSKATQIDSSSGRYKGLSKGEVALLRRAGADKVDPGIRQVVERETEVLSLQRTTLVDELMFWADKPPPGKAIDARKESRRLQENAALGRPINTDAVPTIEKKSSKSIFSGWF
jgi:hypothetical protein